MTNPETRPSFPITEAALSHSDRDLRRFREAVEIIVSGAASERIRNIDYVNAKDVLSRILSKTWETQVSEPHFWQRQHRDGIPESVRDLYDDIFDVSLHTLPGRLKKVDALGVDHPAAHTMANVLREYLPLSQMITALKDNVVKRGQGGEVTPPRIDNPDKVIGTCPCCTRPIAVSHEGRGGMALHGYRRTGPGSVSDGSCDGSRLPPVELSPTGFTWLITRYDERIKSLKQGQPTNRTDAIIQALEHAIARFQQGIDEWRPGLLVKNGRPFVLPMDEPDDNHETNESSQSPMVD